MKPHKPFKAATEEQIGHLRFFGCSSEENITYDQANECISECARLSPEREKEWQQRPATSQIADLEEEKRRWDLATADITVRFDEPVSPKNTKDGGCLLLILLIPAAFIVGLSLCFLWQWFWKL